MSVVKGEDGYEVWCIRIQRWEKTEKLYKLEAERDRQIKLCAKEWQRLCRIPDTQFWRVVMSTQLYDILQGHDQKAAITAAKALLEYHGYDCIKKQ